MPRMRRILSLGALLVWAQTAAAGEPPTSTSGCPCRAQCHPVAAYSLSPGCCEPRRHCCDNAWDGYCQERARWDAFWCKVGTGAFLPSCTPCAAYDVRGAAFEFRLRPGAAACGCEPAPAAVVPAAQR